MVINNDNYFHVFLIIILKFGFFFLLFGIYIYIKKCILVMSIRKQRVRITRPAHVNNLSIW